MSVWYLLVANLFSILCAGAAAFLCYEQRKGWGWFLVAGLLGTASGILSDPPRSTGAISAYVVPLISVTLAQG